MTSDREPASGGRGEEPADPARDCPYCGERTDDLLVHLLACPEVPKRDADRGEW